MTEWLKSPAKNVPFAFAATPPNIGSVVTPGPLGSASRKIGWCAAGTLVQAIGTTVHA